jgi:imidazoleglycerol-phosphate dehydratase
MRKASSGRETKETKVFAELSLDGTGTSAVSTGIGFFDHMLEILARHGLIDLTVKAEGDLSVDCHHTVEDVGIALGQALKGALGDKAGIRRYGTCFLPMDEALAMASVDISGRPYLVFEAELPNTRIGDFDADATEEFFRAFAFNAGITLHLKALCGSNAHHIVEALFKALGRALREAAQTDPRERGVPSTKGIL